MRKYTKAETRFNEQVVEAAKRAHGIKEPCRSWSDWYDAGFLVRPEEKPRPLFKAEIRLYGCEYLAEFYGSSQVAPHPCRKAARCAA